MKVIFLGTPEFAIPTLNMLIEKHTVVGVVTQEDKPVGRSQKPVYSPVKKVALAHNIPVYQYHRIRKEGIEDLKALNADVMVTCAYGQILSQEILDITPVGVINVHGSLLPKYRGSAPIQWSIINGERTTGITILRSEAGMDDGDILLKEETNIGEYETSAELFSRLSVMGAECLDRALKLIETGKAVFTPQNHEEATVCKMIKPYMAKVDFNSSARDIANLVHGLNIWPVVKLSIQDFVFKIFTCRVLTKDDLQNIVPDLEKYEAGQVVLANSKRGLVVKCGIDYLHIIELQNQNSKRMTSNAFLNGKHINVGEFAHSVVEDE